MNIQEPTTIGLSESAHDKLKWLKEEEYFNDLLDGYRFAIGLALAQGIIDPPEVEKRTTIFNIGTVDPDQSLKQSIQAIMGNQLRGVSTYRMAERLAEWGVNELESQARSDGINFIEILGQTSKGEDRSS